MKIWMNLKKFQTALHSSKKILIFAKPVGTMDAQIIIFLRIRQLLNKVSFKLFSLLLYIDTEIDEKKIF